MPEQPSADASVTAKRCCRCGKDLTGRTRYKNHEGYWCKRCNADDELRKSRLGGGKRHNTGLTLTLISLGVGLALVLVYLWLR